MSAEEIITVSEPTSQQVVKKTVRNVEPAVRTEAPQKVYDKKKTLFRSNQIIWYILGVIEVLLVFRLVLKVLGANPYVGFTSFIYGVTNPLALPFNGIVGATVSGNSLIEWSTVIAAIVYLCIAWGLAYLLNLLNPITPHDVAVH